MDLHECQENESFGLEMAGRMLWKVMTVMELLRGRGCVLQARHAAFECLSGGGSGGGCADGGSSASSSEMFNGRSSSADDSLRSGGSGSGASAAACSRPTSPLLHHGRPSSAQVTIPTRASETLSVGLFPCCLSFFALCTLYQ